MKFIFTCRLTFQKGCFYGYYKHHHFFSQWRAVGGNIAGAAMSQKNLGPIVNTIAGLIGGGVGEFILKAFGIITAIIPYPAVEDDLANPC